MKVAIITGSAGLIGSEAARFYANKGFRVVGIDNNMRAKFFGASASTYRVRTQLEKEFKQYRHHTFDLRNTTRLTQLFKKYNTDTKLIIHTAAQPSHDWAARDPHTDFSVNANATLNLLELSRRYCSKAVFIFTSTNKVYGDTPNSLPLKEKKTRYDLSSTHKFYRGINEAMSIDQCKHSLFGASKAAADILVQEYGRYFDMKTVCFRGGCLTGPQHAGAELHGFLSYLMKCCLSDKAYKIIGYGGKQVRDNIHCADLIDAFHAFYRKPRKAAVYNIGGGRANSCSVIEAIDLCERITEKTMKYSFVEKARIGDHQWYISDLRKFKKDYPQWKIKKSLKQTLIEISEKKV